MTTCEFVFMSHLFMFIVYKRLFYSYLIKRTNTNNKKVSSSSIITVTEETKWKRAGISSLFSYDNHTASECIDEMISHVASHSICWWCYFTKDYLWFIFDDETNMTNHVNRVIEVTVCCYKPICGKRGDNYWILQCTRV